ncbi:hypothetical protein Tco_1285953 [Tanacetum coccineum]
METPITIVIVSLYEPSSLALAYGAGYNIKSGGSSAAVLCAAKALGQFNHVEVDITTLSIMLYMKSISVNANDEASRMLRAKAMECISLLERKVFIAKLPWGKMFLYACMLHIQFYGNVLVSPSRSYLVGAHNQNICFMHFYSNMLLSPSRSYLFVTPISVPWNSSLLAVFFVAFGSIM